MKKIALALVFIMCASFIFSGDIAQYVNLGFSSNSKYFMFGQYGISSEDTKAFAETFIVDVVKDFGNILFSSSQDEKKAVIALGGSISKHHAILCTLLNGGANYAVYMTTAHKTSGSMSGATTEEAKSWGKVKDDSDVATVIGDVTIMFPLAMIKALEELSEEGLLE